MKKDVFSFKLLNLLLLVALIFLIYIMKDLWFGIVAKIINILMPFILGFVIAYILYPLLKWLEKKGISKGLAVVLITVTLFSVITVIGVTLIPNIIPLLSNQVLSFLDSSKDIVRSLSKNFNLDLNMVEAAINKATINLSDGFGKTISEGIFGIIGESINILSRTIIALISSVYFLIDMEQIRKTFKKYVSHKNTKSFKYFTALDNSIYDYLNGLSLYVLIQFVEYTVIFYLIGHPNYLLLGLLACFSPLIPYFGGIMMMIVALLSASMVSTNLLILTAVIALIMPNVDGYYTFPRIFKKSNSIPGILTIFAVFAGGVLYGVVGIIIDIPFTIVILTTYRFYKKDIMEKIDDIKEIIT